VALNTELKRGVNEIGPDEKRLGFSNPKLNPAIDA